LYKKNYLFIFITIATYQSKVKNMGDARVRLAKTQADFNSFTRHIIRDLEAMNRMLNLGWFESEDMKIGAEQEMCLVDRHGKPSSNNLQILEKLNHQILLQNLPNLI
jgi:hypothetical protein